MSFNLTSRTWWLGLALAVAVAVLAGYSAEWIGESVFGLARSPVSAIMLAIILGMVLSNSLNLAPVAADGLKFCSTTVLRVGIALLRPRPGILDIFPTRQRFRTRVRPRSRGERKAEEPHRGAGGPPPCRPPGVASSCGRVARHRGM